jgi:hypothetical protein
VIACRSLTQCFAAYGYYRMVISAIYWLQQCAGDLSFLGPLHRVAFNPRLSGKWMAEIETACGIARSLSASGTSGLVVIAYGREPAMS